VAPALEHDVLFKSSLPPCKRPRLRPPLADDDPPGHGLEPRDAQLLQQRHVLPEPIPAARWQHVSEVTISFDGSAGHGVAGWGVTVLVPGRAFTLDLCGPVEGQGSPLWIGAVKFSNNTAELSALFVALRWATSFIPEGIVHMQYDSSYAHGVTTRVLKPTTNLSLVLAVRTALTLVTATISWEKISAHTGDIFNEQADQLAKFGSSGNVRGSFEGWLALPP
jgi:ribonuclease HI